MNAMGERCEEESGERGKEKEEAAKVVLITISQLPACLRDKYLRYGQGRIFRPKEKGK